MSHDSNLVALFEQIAPSIGAKLKVEPRYQRSGMLEFPNGKVLFFRNNHLNINVAGNARMAADKSFLSFFLAEMGFRVLAETTISRYDVSHDVASSSKFEQVLRFAMQNEWRIIVKPNSLSQGRGVRLINDLPQLLSAITDTLAIDRVCIVQHYCAMPEYRLIVLNGTIEQAYRRRPMMVTGDGSSTIDELIRQRADEISKRRDENNAKDLYQAAVRALESRGRSTCEVASSAEEIIVAETANLSAGGEADDVMQFIHPRWISVGAELAKRSGLLLCGIDIFIEDICDGDSEYRVIELNSAPGLDDYLLQGQQQGERVRMLYQKVLEIAATGPHEPD